MANVTTYNPKQVTMAYGSHIVTGYAEDSFITVEPMGNGTSSKVGCDGEVVRSIDPDGRFSVKITVLQNSPTNAYLQQVYDKDRTTGDEIQPLLVKDIKGNTSFSADKAWVAKPMSFARGKEAGNVEWTLECADGQLEMQ